MIVDTTTDARVEKDSLGSLEIPVEAYWGIHTARALQNFPISARPIAVHPELVRALAMVKQACARANRDIGALDAGKADLIDRAAQLVIDGRFHDQFRVDVIQGGAGTSTNMNANEVITNIALELAGRAKGDYAFLSPIDDTNRSQSTNDVYPTAIKVGLALELESLLRELDLLRGSFLAKGAEFHGILKVGRTQLQDAVPMTLGQEFTGFATTMGEDRNRLGESGRLLREVNLGATAIGTGITAPPGYAAAALRHLRAVSGLDLVPAADLVESTSDTGAFMTFSAALKRNAIKLSKICDDLRLLSSGPQAGFGELVLPARQAGSSIMPGKVNPVIPEVVNQVAFAVAGADLTVTMAAAGGQLQLNAFEPVIAHSVFQSIVWMRQAMHTLRVNCVEGIAADTERLGVLVGSSVGVVTALIPRIGYATAAGIATTALRTRRSVGDLVVEAGLMTRDDVEVHLSAARLSGERTRVENGADLERALSARGRESHPQRRLEPVKEALALLGSPHRRAPIIHITGTNGKTSTARIAASILGACGLSTGLFTSPHLVAVNERIVIGGAPIGDDALATAWTSIAPAIEEVDARLRAGASPVLSPFEVLTVLAFQAFALAGVEAAVVEVGLGGEWDATNAADADVAVFTPIDLDHVAILGPTIADIARTKAGIVKPGSSVVSARQSATVARELARAASLRRASLVEEGSAFEVVASTSADDGQDVLLRGLTRAYPGVRLPLLGEFQAQNAALAVAAVESLFSRTGRALDADAVLAGLRSASSPGRMQYIEGTPPIVVDAAHNPHGVAATVRELSRRFAGRPIVAVVAVLRDKDWQGMVRRLASVAESVVVTSAPSERATPVAELAEAARASGLTEVHATPDVASALRLAEELALARGDALVLVAGSITLAGAAIDLLGRRAR